VKKGRKRTSGGTSAAEPKRPSRWAAPALIAALVLVFYLVPLTSESASIQWDAADVHYPFQKYWSDHVRSASLPSWTPYVFAGYPFLAYPETAAWYPPHWPFFLIGITPRMIQAELALNAFLACLGAFLLISRFVENRAAAVLGDSVMGCPAFLPATLLTWGSSLLRLVSHGCCWRSGARWTGAPSAIPHWEALSVPR